MLKKFTPRRCYCVRRPCRESSSSAQLSNHVMNSCTRSAGTTTVRSGIRSSMVTASDPSGLRSPGKASASPQWRVYPPTSKTSSFTWMGDHDPQTSRPSIDLQFSCFTSAPPRSRAASEPASRAALVLRTFPPLVLLLRPRSRCASRPGEYATDRLTDEAIEFVEGATGPYFLWPPTRCRTFRGRILQGRLRDSG